MLAPLHASFTHQSLLCFMNSIKPILLGGGERKMRGDSVWVVEASCHVTLSHIQGSCGCRFREEPSELEQPTSYAMYLNQFCQGLRSRGEGCGMF